MNIYTGNFANLKKYEGRGLFPISIALSARYFNGVCYKKLNPDWSFKDDFPSLYIPKYNQKLKQLNPHVVMSELSQISNGKDVVLLCHEKEGDFCHRRLVAEWLEKELNIKVKELGKMETKQIDLFAENYEIMTIFAY